MGIPEQAIDEAFERAMASCKKHFREAVDVLSKTQDTKLKHMKESDDRTIEKLKRLVQEEEKAINKFKRKAEQSYRNMIPRVQKQSLNGIASTEAQIAKEEAQIAQLNGQIRRYGQVSQTPVKETKVKSEKQDPLP